MKIDIVVIPNRERVLYDLKLSSAIHIATNEGRDQFLFVWFFAFLKKTIELIPIKLYNVVL